MTQFEQLATLQKEAKTNFELISFWDAGYRVRIGDAANGYKVEQTFDQMDSAVLWLIEELEKNVKIIDTPIEGGGYMRYLKFILAAVATVMSGIVLAMTGDSTISNVEWVNISISGAGALAVFAAPNVPGALYTKTILSALTAALTALVSFITDDVITTSEWLQIGIAVMIAVGVYAVPNSPGEAMSAKTAYRG